MKKLLITILTCITLIAYSNPKLDKPSVYLDCGYGCDLNFIKKEVSFVDFYIDPNSVNVHILISSETTGNGGKQVTFRFVGKEDFNGITNVLTTL